MKDTPESIERDEPDPSEPPTIDFGPTTPTRRRGGRSQAIKTATANSTAEPTKVTVPDAVKKSQAKPSSMLNVAVGEDLKSKKSASLDEMLDDPKLIATEAFKKLKVRGLMEFADLPDDPDSNLLGRRWLERGAMAMLFAPSGVGKTSIALQASAEWSLGQEAFGIKPERPLRILIIQAEDSDLDMREPMIGIRVVCGLTDVDCATISERVKVVSSRSTGLNFLRNVLLPAIVEHEPDLVILNPMFAFKDAGVDLSKQTEAASFIRHELLQIADKMKVGIIGEHHTNKPNNTDWDKVNEYHLQYGGSGSADITNAVRAILAILPMGNGVFRFAGAKRWQKLGWKETSSSRENDDDTQSFKIVSSKFYSHHYASDGYAWVEADAADVESARKKKPGAGRPRDVPPLEFKEHLEDGRSYTRRELDAIMRPLMPGKKPDAFDKAGERLLEKMLALGFMVSGKKGITPRRSNRQNRLCRLAALHDQQWAKTVANP